MYPQVVRRLLSAALGTLAVGALALVAPGAAAAQGSDYSHAQYQVTFSINCNHASCAGDFGGLFGEWGWVALTPNGNGNAQVTFCGHTVGGGGPGSAGAGHLAGDVTWQAFSSPTPPPFTPADPNGNYLLITGAGGFELAVPATHGHYSVSIDGATGEITTAP